jgi:hypothetical protein
VTQPESMADNICEEEEEKRREDNSMRSKEKCAL